MNLHLSKSLLNNYRQCPRRLWLEMQDRAARKQGQAPLAQASYSADAQKRFLDGHVIGRIAKARWPKGIDIEAQSWVEDNSGHKRRDLSYAQHLTHMWLMQGVPLFEATFSHSQLLVMADVMRPAQRGGKTVWQMIEVKSSTTRKDYHITDLATQVWVAQQCGVPVVGAALMLVNKGFTLQTAGDYTGLLDLHQDAELHEQLREAIRQMPATLKGAHNTLAQAQEPTQHQPGAQCTSPYECPYLAHCTQADRSARPSKAVPIRFYNDRSGAKAQQLLDAGHTDLRKVPAKTVAALWNGESDTHRVNQRLAQAVRTGQAVLDRAGAQAELQALRWPVQHLDFETISFVAPVWPGTRNGQQIPFQYSMHRQAQSGQVLAHSEFLDTSGQDPRRALAEQLVKDIDPRCTVLAWNDSFERAVIRDLADTFADLHKPLMRIHDQVQDLLPIVRRHYFHPDMAAAEGSTFSIKTVLPCMVPHLQYSQLNSVQNGGEAQLAYLLAAAPKGAEKEPGQPITKAEREQARKDLLAYCGLDTEAMVEVLNFLKDKND
jgi:CRISPR/Cas system-associated exonuclease Cas4 (RecB family)